MPREIVIRPFQTVADYRACEQLQQSVWQFPDREIVPLNELMGVERSHGLVIGAFLGKRMVGFLFGLHGLHPQGERHPGGRIFHVSRMLAVARDFQSHAIGFHLKCAQRQWCLGQGIARACWTFDPLQAGNAHFNIAKLGVTCGTYLVDVYGRSSSVLNRGMQTDRLQVDWDLNSRRVRAKTAESEPRAGFPSYGDIRFANECRTGADGFLIPVRGSVAPRLARVAIEIPAGINALMAARLDLARRWRTHLRALLLDHFARGFRVVDFVCSQREGREAMAYILQRIG